MTFLTRMPVVLIVCGLLLGSVLYAGGQCKVPDDEFEFCSDIEEGELGGCDEPLACSGLKVVKLDREQWPKGSKAADEGTVKESREKCYQKGECVKDPDTGKCTPRRTGSWEKGDKVVEDTRECPETI